MENLSPFALPPKIVTPTGSWREKLSAPLQDISWIVEGWLSNGDITLLYADGGTGKSWKAAHIAMCVANDRSVDEMFHVKQSGNVLWIDNENGPDESQRRAKLLDRSKYFDKWENDIRFLETGHWRADEKGLNILTRLIEEHNPVLLVIDSLVSILPDGKSENSAEDMRSTIDGITETIRASVRPPACLILHHTRKQSSEEGGDRWPTFRGSGDIKNAATYTMVMRSNSFIDKKGNERSTVQYRWEKVRRGRKDQNIYQFALVDRKDSVGDVWVEHVAFGKVKSATELLEERILDCFDSLTDSYTRKEIEELIEYDGSISFLNKILVELEHKKLIRVSDQTGKRGAKIYSKSTLK